MKQRKAAKGAGKRAAAEPPPDQPAAKKGKGKGKPSAQPAASDNVCMKHWAPKGMWCPNRPPAGTCPYKCTGRATRCRVVHQESAASRFVAGRMRKPVCAGLLVKLTPRRC